MTQKQVVKITNHIRINDWSGIETEFDELNKVGLSSPYNAAQYMPFLEVARCLLLARIRLRSYVDVSTAADGLQEGAAGA